AATEPELAYLVDHSESVLTVARAEDAELVERLRSRCRRLRGGLFVGGAPAAEAGRSRVSPPLGVNSAPSPANAHPSPLLADLLASSSADPPEADVAADDEAAILYTSGTTARPKGVLVTHANYLWVGEVVAQAVRFTAGDRAFAVLPYF